jgi:hypothetical protein
MKELRSFETILKKIGKRAEGLTGQKCKEIRKHTRTLNSPLRAYGFQP